MVLFSGGLGTSGAATTSELYNPTTQSFQISGALNTARIDHTATLLTTGMVLITGGLDANSNAVLQSAELYNPLTGEFTPTGSLISARAFHTATLLSNGMVLITGGDANSNALASTELYNPTTGSFTSSGSMASARYLHTATLLQDGTVLLAGGVPVNNSTTPIAACEIYTPATGTVSQTANLNHRRADHTATQLPDGTVLMIGGYEGASTLNTVAELYTPSTQTFTNTSQLAQARYLHTATLLAGNQILVTGGQTGTQYSSVTASSELFTTPMEGGYLSPKFVVLGVAYAPPGAGSSVTYSDTSLLATTTTLDDVFTNSTSIAVTNTIGLGLGIGPVNASTTGTAVVTGTYAYTKDSTTAETIQRSTQVTLEVNGPASSAVGVDHDYDIVSVWFNPVANITIAPSAQSSVMWTGYSFDDRDPNSYGSPDVIGFPVLCLKNPYSSYCTQYAVFYNRAWDSSGSGGFTLADYAQILSTDPFGVNPNYEPRSDPSTRFSVQADYPVQYTVAAPGQGAMPTTGALTVTNTTSSTLALSDSYMVAISLDLNTSQSFLALISNDIKTTNTTGWTSKASTLHSASNSSVASFKVVNPLATDNYQGPPSFNVWLDNLYSTFMFYSPNAQQVPTATIALSLSSLSFGTQAVGSISSPQTITITNMSSASMSFDPSKDAAISVSPTIGPKGGAAPSNYVVLGNTCLGTTPLAPGASCTATVAFSPQNSNPAGLTSDPGTLIVTGVEQAPGSANVLVSSPLQLTGTASR